MVINSDHNYTDLVAPNSVAFSLILCLTVIEMNENLKMLFASTGPVLGQYQLLSRTGPVLAHKGMFTGILMRT